MQLVEVDLMPVEDVSKATRVGIVGSPTSQRPCLDAEVVPQD